MLGELIVSCANNSTGMEKLCDRLGTAALRKLQEAIAVVIIDLAL
jgi:hypothetical protein